MRIIEFVDDDGNAIIDELIGEPLTLEVSDEGYELLVNKGREIEGEEVTEEEAIQASVLRALKEAIEYHGNNS